MLETNEKQEKSQQRYKRYKEEPKRNYWKKNIISQIIKSIDGWAHSRMEGTEKRISKLEGKIIVITQLEQ